MTLDQVDDQPQRQRPALTIAEAVTATGISRSTVRRYAATGLFPTAYRDEESLAWRIPVGDLLAAGWTLTSQGSKQPEQVKSARDQAIEQELDRREQPLRDLLAQAQQRATLAEALAAERSRTIDLLATALRAIERAPSPSQVIDLRSDSPEPAAPRRWYRRKQRP